MEFSLAHTTGNSAFYRDDLPSSVSISTGPTDPTPYSKVFRGDVTEQAFFFTPDRSDLGKMYTVNAAWAEDAVALPVPPPCQRSTTGGSRVFRGLAPRIKVTNDNNYFNFEVVQRSGILCEQTRRGSVRIVVRGPDRRRSIKLRDTCGRWTKSTGGRGWRLRKEQNYRYSALLGEDDALASLYIKFRTPGTRHFSYRVTFRGRRVAWGSFDVVSRLR